MSEFGAVGYAMVGGLYTVLTVLLLTSWRGGRIGGYLIAACVMSIVWCAVLAFHTVKNSIDPLGLFIVELLRAGAWVTFFCIPRQYSSVR